MSRQLENLRRVFGKLRSHYGEEDEIVSQFKQEVESLESAESGYQLLAVASTRGLPGNLAQRRHQVASNIRSAGPVLQHHAQETGG